MTNAARIYTGKDAWRNHFSANAADILQLQRVFAGESVFKTALMMCLNRGKGERINERTVCAVLSEMK